MPERRMQLECCLECPKCQARPYRLYRRQNAQPNGQPLGTYENVLWPAHPDVPPPTNPERIVCPHCGEAVKRVAA